MIVSKQKSWRNNGERILYKFTNKRFASVIRNPYSKGGKDGLWEIAILDSDGNLDYTTPITDDVIGNLKWDEVKKILRKINSLPKLKKEKSK